MNVVVRQSFCFIAALLLSGCALSGSYGSDFTKRNRARMARDWQNATFAAVNKYSYNAERRLLPYFQGAGVAYPPKKVAILAFKNERKVELWAKQANDQWHFIRHYPLTAYSGKLGPKLRAHDLQIPEGVYQIGFLSPFSAWHLSMKLNYPNQFDLEHAKLDGRSSLGGDIFIHGRASSVGCLAVGDSAIEELFVLVAKTGTHAAKVIIAPNDMRIEASRSPLSPHWVPELNNMIAAELMPFQIKSQAV